MNRLFRWGIILALLVLIGSSLMAMRIIFVDEADAVVPNVVGTSVIEATSRLQNAGLEARIDQVDSDQPEGTVISQAISPGEKVQVGKIVNIKVSRGGTKIQVPDVRGMDFADAVRALDTSGLKIGTVLRVADALKPAGTVIAQNPASPAAVLNTKMIELLVSEGKSGKAETIQVPDLKGQSETLARQILEQSDLKVARVISIESNVVPPGTIARTQPNAGARVPFGGQVTLYIAKTPESRPPADAGTADTSPAAAVQTTQPVASTVTSTTAPVTSTTGRVTSTTTPVTSTTSRPPEEGAASAVTTTPVIPVDMVTGTQTTTPPAAGSKMAKIRYQVPPLSRVLPLKISISDQTGTRVLRDQQANGGEYISIDMPYTGNATVVVNLGGETVWEEKYK